MKIHLVLLVLTMASSVILGSDYASRKGTDAEDDHPIQVTMDANSISTSTEMQGAILTEVKEVTSNKGEMFPNLPTAEEESDLATNLSQVEATTSTIPRSNRQGPNGKNRDSKLMTLLAARRSALQRDRFRTHRRIATTNRTTIDTTSRNPQDPRTTCERNCTKNFTRRTTASCMRRCVSMHRSTNTTTPPPTTTVRTKVDEKDNNEILFTDESSHGFFVVTKELNDTTNHISDGGKIASTSTEKNYKIKMKLRTPISTEEIDMRPYVFFGQKLPPLKPTALKITKVSDDHPKILEVSITKPTDRTKTRNRFNPRERSIAAFNKRNGFGNYTRQFTLTSTVDPAFRNFKNISYESLTKESKVEGNSSIPLLVQRIIPESAKLNASTDSASKSIDELFARTSMELMPVTVTTKKLIPITSTTEAVSTPLIIYVPETAEDKEDIAPDFANDTVVLQTQTSTIAITSTNPNSSFSCHPCNNSVSATTSSSAPLATLATPSNSTTEILTTTTMSSTSTASMHSQIVQTSTVQNVLSTTPKKHLPKEVNNETNEFRSNDSVFSIIEFINVQQNSNNSLKDHEEIGGVLLINDKGVTIEMNRINTATYVLAGLGMFPVAIIILYVGRSVLLKHRSKDEDDMKNYITEQQQITPVHKMNIEKEKDDQYSINSSYQEFDRSKVRFKSLLGEGNFGQVWKAEADDLSEHMGATRIVAVKTIRDGGNQAGLKEEADIMRKLSSHPNVVTLLGLCIDTEPHLLIMEYAMRGRLLSLLRAARSATNILPASVPGGRSLAPLSPRTLAGFALDIASGMEYIAEKKIVHRDLAARNVLLDHNGVCKICDFGMSINLEAPTKTQTSNRETDLIRSGSHIEHRVRLEFGVRLTNHWNHINSGHSNNNNNVISNHEKKQHDSINKRPALPIRWMAPEALQYHIFSTETDVWAFGIVLWEIATLGCTPYPNLSGREVVRSIPNGTRPELPTDGRPEFYDLMSRCWHKDPRQRPTFKEARIDIARTICKWVDEDTANSDYMDVSGFSEDLEHGMVYFNRRISEFECDI